MRRQYRKEEIRKRRIGSEEAGNEKNEKGFDVLKKKKKHIVLEKGKISQTVKIKFKSRERERESEEAKKEGGNAEGRRWRRRRQNKGRERGSKVLSHACFAVVSLISDCMTFVALAGT